MGLIDVIRRTVKRELKNIEELTVNIIRPGKERQDLLLENGNGASVKLSGEDVIINGTPFDGSTGGYTPPKISYTVSGTGLWGEPSITDRAFAHDVWGSFGGMYLPGSLTPSGLPGYYVHQLEAAKCTFVDVNKVLDYNGDNETYDMTLLYINDDRSQTVYAGSDIELQEGWSLDVVEIAGDQAHIRLYSDGDIIEDAYITPPYTYTYEKALNGAAFPIIAVYFSEVFVGQETSSVRVEGVWQVSDYDNLATAVSIDAAGVYLYEPSNVDMQSKLIQLASGSTVGDTADDPGNLVVQGSSNVKIGANGVEALRVSDTAVTPKKPVDMGTLSITTSKDTFDANELVDKEYVDLVVGTSSHTTEDIQDIVGAMAYAGTGMSVYYDDALGRFTYTCTVTGGGNVDSVFGRTGAVTAQQADYDDFYSLIGHSHSNYLSTTGTAYNSNRLGNSYYTNYSKTTHTHAYLPLTGGTVTGLLTVNGGILSKSTLVFGDSYGAGTESIGFNSGVMYISALSGVDFDAPVNMNGNKITGLVNPTAASDAVTKTYVDDYYLRRIGGTSYPMAGYLFTGGYGIAFESTTPMNTWITTGVNSTKTYLQLMGKDEVLISSGGATGKLRAKIDSGGLTLLNSDNTQSATIAVNANGDLVFHVAAGKGIIFEEG